MPILNDKRPLERYPESFVRALLQAPQEAIIGEYQTRAQGKTGQNWWSAFVSGCKARPTHWAWKTFDCWKTKTKLEPGIGFVEGKGPWVLRVTFHKVENKSLEELVGEAISRKDRDGL